MILKQHSPGLQLTRNNPIQQILWLLLFLFKFASLSYIHVSLFLLDFFFAGDAIATFKFHLLRLKHPFQGNDVYVSLHYAIIALFVFPSKLLNFIGIFYLLLGRIKLASFLCRQLQVDLSFGIVIVHDIWAVGMWYSGQVYYCNVHLCLSFYYNVQML